MSVFYTKDTSICVKICVTVEDACPKEAVDTKKNHQNDGSSPKEKPSVIFGGCVGCVDWLPSFWCEILELKTTVKFQNQWFASYLYQNYNNPQFFENTSPFPLRYRLIVLRGDSMDSDVTKSLSFALDRRERPSTWRRGRAEGGRGIGPGIWADAAPCPRGGC